MKIGTIKLKNSLILAPMAGTTDVAFRSLCIEAGADCGVTEMVSAKALCYNNKKTIDLLFTAQNEKIKIVQIFGSDTEIMAKACQLPILEKFDIIDINMGCPVSKIVKNGEGSFLMTYLQKAEEIIRACVKATKKPITVKFRAGWNDECRNAVDFAKMCERAGASAITIHGRTRMQMYSGLADRNLISDVAHAVSIPVIGNGDVQNKEDYNEMLKLGCAGVMIARGALGNPGIFAEITGGKPKPKKEYILEHITSLRGHYADRFIAKHMKKHILWYLKGIKNSSQIKNAVVKIDNLNKLIEFIKNTEF